MVAIFILAMLVYNVFLKSDSISTTGTTPKAALGADLLELSDAISRATLDQTLFSTPSYRSLTDFTSTIPQQTVGRPNPFDIIGRD